MDTGNSMNEGGVYTLEQFDSICRAEGITDSNSIRLLYNFYVAELYGTDEDVLKEANAYECYLRMKVEHRLN